MINRDNLDERQALIEELAGGGPPAAGAAPAPVRVIGAATGGPPVSSTLPAGRLPLAGDTAPGATAPTAPAADPAAAAGINGMDWRKALGGYNSNGTMLGFNTALDYGNDKAANSVKNTFGRIASRYKNAPSMIDAVMADPDFQRAFPNAKKVPGGAGDKIDFGGVLSDFESGVPVGVVDVLGASDPTNDTAAGWTWQDLANDGGGGPAGGGGGGGDLASLLGAGEALTSNDNLQQILQAIQALSRGQDPTREALLSELTR